MDESLPVFLVLGLALAAFVWNKLRYDLVALLALLLLVIVGVIPVKDAFSGFGHPAVITVAAVLVLSRGFQRSGLVSLLARRVLRTGRFTTIQVLLLTLTVALLSAFMNNVGALALLMPVALRLARKYGTWPSSLLMPLAFGSLLGGMLTLIGTPANIIVSEFRAEQLGAGFRMFDFLPVGGGVALVGVLFLALVGWRLIPRRKGRRSAEEMFETANYLSELEVVSGSAASGWTLQELRRAYGQPVPLVMVLRREERYPAHAFLDRLREGDVLIVEAEPEELAELAAKGGFKVGGARLEERLEGIEELGLYEAVVQPDSLLVGKTAEEVRLLDQYGVHLLAVARKGLRLRQRLKEIRFEASDVLLLQGDANRMPDSLAELKCLPLVSRDIQVGRPRRLLVSVGIFAATVTTILLGWLPASVALVLAAAGNVLAGVLPVREVYDAVDWPVIVLLAALIPVGQALETTGGAKLIADGMLVLGRAWPPVVALALLFALTMFLSNLINNAAAALLMAPVGFSLAQGFGVSADPFLMAVAVSASCAFLTPIGHQSNTLVLGPGGYHFGDYWRSGLPLSILVAVVAITLILRVWPLTGSVL